MTDTSKVNWIGVIVLIGSLLMIAGVFLSWASASFTLSSFTVSANATGMDVFSGNTTISYESISSTIDTSFEYSYAPIVTLVAGIIALLGSIVMLGSKNQKAGKALGALSVILAIVAIILMVLFNSGIGSDSFDFGIVSGGLSTGSGLWVCMVGAVLAVIGGVIALARKDKGAEAVES